ncbi:MAG: hypothetical protein NC926_08050 [Candidatus Omnitrophica bacterium]|nr:hypothetical protein [Candidatus Omnitrophota bacterium]
MKIVKEFFEKIRKKVDDILFYSIITGVILLSLGVYLMGSGIERSIGRDMIILGSGIFYVSVVIFTFKI